MREKPDQKMQPEARAQRRYRAVLFDVGGPLDMETERERLIDGAIRAGLAQEGRFVSDEEYREAERWAVESFCPNAYQAIVWKLAGGDRPRAERAHRWMRAAVAGRQLFELRPGMLALVQELHARGLLLGLAANQPRSALDSLDRAGIGRYFHHREVTGVHGFQKPDVRLFLRACEDLGVAPAECIMVGDRIDNDIAPARLLGMGTVLFRTGRHSAQQPRSWEELPDAEVEGVVGLEQALLGLLERASAREAAER